MIILSVDFGDARTGIAVCDKNEMLASPVCVITEYNFERLAQKISQLALEKHAELIVMGNPLNMDGTSGERSVKAKELSSLIESLSSLPVAMWDERRTTVTAASFLNETNVRGKKRKAVIDAVSAVIILESYLAYRKNANQR